MSSCFVLFCLLELWQWYTQLKSTRTLYIHTLNVIDVLCNVISHCYNFITTISIFSLLQYFTRGCHLMHLRYLPHLDIFYCITMYADHTLNLQFILSRTLINFRINIENEKNMNEKQKINNNKKTLFLIRIKYSVVITITEQNRTRLITQTLQKNTSTHTIHVYTELTWHGKSVLWIAQKYHMKSIRIIIVSFCNSLWQTSCIYKLL